MWRPIQVYMSKQGEATTVRLSRPVKSRLDSVKPYESMSYDEFIDELVTQYEGEV